MNTPLILNQPGFVLNNARALAAMCQVAYHPETDPTAFIIADAATGTLFLLWEFDNCLAVAAQGTRNLKQWLADFNFVLESYPDGALGAGVKVHRGFLRDVESVQAPVANWLAQRPGKPILFGGHSKGGAEVVLVAAILKQAGFPVHSVYTFGQPRVGNAAFAAVYNSLLGPLTWRVVFQNDIIARIPAIWHQYRPNQQLALINAANRLQFNPSRTELLISDALGLFGPWRNSLKVGLAKWQTIYDLVEMAEILGRDHFIQNYVAALHDLQLS